MRGADAEERDGEHARCLIPRDVFSDGLGETRGERRREPDSKL